MTAAKESWTCVGLTVRRSEIVQGAKDYQLARRNSDGAFAIVKQIGNSWSLHGPVCTIETAYRTAENVAAGNPRALTWPDMPLMLATALLAIEWLASSPASPGLPGGETGTPSTDAVRDPLVEGDRGPSMPAGGAASAAASLDGQSGRAAHSPELPLAPAASRDAQRQSVCECGG